VHHPTLIEELPVARLLLASFACEGCDYYWFLELVEWHY
jgi:hypothetical protein